MRLKKLLIGFFALLILPFCLVSCGEKTPAEPEEVQYFDTPATEIDHYFSNKLTFADMGTTVKKNAAGKLEGKFIKDGVAKLVLKSCTDGDTAVFYLNGENDTYTVTGKSYPYVTIRFQGIDTPESTSSIEAWGKKASNYGKSLLKNAAGIIVDASDLESDPSKSYIDRRDSNGTRWLGLVWYCPQGKDPEDLKNYRSYQLDVIEECYSLCSSFETSRYAYLANKETEPILYSRYENVKNMISGEMEQRFGSIKLNELFFEADNRMAKCATKFKVHGEVDDSFDYSKNPQEMSITDAIKNIDTLMSKGTYVCLKGVITRFVESNFYFQDEKGTALYVYMGIDGNSIGKSFNVGDTIKIRGRLCEYGGQYQMSGIIFKQETFEKITDPAQKIAMPEPIVLTGNETVEEIKACLGKLVTTTLTFVNKGSQSKNGAYSLSSNRLIKGLESLESLIDYNKYYPSICYMEVRINGQLVPGYDYESFPDFNKSNTGTYTVTGIMSIYQEEDYTKENNYPAYQIVVGNRYRSDGNNVDEIVKAN